MKIALWYTFLHDMHENAQGQKSVKNETHLCMPAHLQITVL